MMKTNKARPQTQKLALRRETLRQLGAMELRQVAGGQTVNNCDDTTIDASFDRGCTTLVFSVCPC